ncbi:MAG: S41 family peptidase [Planctomycetota bacterium]
MPAICHTVIRFCLLVSFASVAAAETKLLRFPDIHDDTVVFVYAGDLWRASVDGGNATRITAHPGMEVFPKFSPDGTQIAFTGQYDGDEQVYVIPAIGGEPRQLTYYPANGPLPDRWGYDNQVYGWTKDGKAVLFRSMRHASGLTDTRLYTVDVEGGLPTALPMRVSGAGDYSPDGRQVVFSPLVRDFRTWKRYEGGWAQDLYTFDLDSYDFKQITSDKRSDRDPMWIGSKIYFTSDRDGTFNLYRYDLATGTTEQVTHSTEADVRWPSAGGKQIVYELAGELHVLDTDTDETRKLSIHVPTDSLATRPRRERVGNDIADYAVSPDGNRVVFVARGDLLSAPVTDGVVRTLTQTSHAHEKEPNWSPDGKQIAYLSDETGEEELYVMPANGKGNAEQLTRRGTGMRYAPLWSPDGKRIALADKEGRVSVVDVASKKVKQVADEARGQVDDYVWSPNGGHLAMSLSNETESRSIYIWSVEDGQLRKVTGDLFNEYSPTWGPEGDYLYYLSDREFAPQIGSQEWNFVVNREVGIFALALRDDVPHPYPPIVDNSEADEADEEDDAADDDAEEEGDKEEDAEDKQDDDEAEAEDEQPKAKDKKQKPEFIKIDFDGLADRVARVPVEADNLYGVVAVDGHLLYVTGGPFFYGRSSGVDPVLMKFNHEDRESEVWLEDIYGIDLGHGGKKLLVNQGGRYKVYNVKGGDAESVNTSRLAVRINPREEWEQIFEEVWRRFRDFFYVENMHGYDWEALHDQYHPLLEHVAHRSDLNYVIGEMIAELNVGHAYKAGGDYPRPERVDVALPGAIFKLDPESERYQIDKIFAGHNEESRYRSPLTEIGVDIDEGDYVLAIDGEELTAAENPYELLQGKASQPVVLTVNDAPDMEGSREVVFRPIRSEDSLVYLNWVLDNHRTVTEATNGRIGYLHLPDMGAAGIREFTKWFYGQIRKEGLIIDVRSNGGGNVSQMVINRLSRPLLATRFARTDDTGGTYPETCFVGHLVCLLDEDSASDGDIFPAMFKEAGLGPLIGKRSWGGVIGITNRGTLIDGGTVNVPEFGFASKTGEWIIEGYGVDPDIEVDNDPKSLIEGKDPQLERGIKEIMDKLKADPRSLPDRPADPIKTKASSR